MSNDDGKKSTENRGPGLAQKHAAVQANKVETDYGHLQEDLRKLDLLTRINLAETTYEEFQQIQKRQEDDERRRANKLPFVTPNVTALSGFAPGEIVLACGTTGSGKSTSVAHEAYIFVTARRKMLILSLEETKEDVLRRIACLLCGQSYANRDSFTFEQRAAVTNGIAEVVKYVRVIDNVEGVLTTPGGLIKTLERIGRELKDCECLMIDYYQKVTADSARNHDWQAQVRVSNALDQLKNTFSGGIIVFAQLHAESKNRVELEDRIKGSRTIFTVCTTCLEIIPNFEDRTTKWVLHKKRHRIGTEKLFVVTDYSNGKHVDQLVISEGDQNE